MVAEVKKGGFDERNGGSTTGCTEKKRNECGIGGGTSGS
jgi:hypothetical protein